MNITRRIEYEGAYYHLFMHTDEQIGQLFGLSDPAIRTLKQRLR